MELARQCTDFLTLLHPEAIALARGCVRRSECIPCHPQALLSSKKVGLGNRVLHTWLSNAVSVTASSDTGQGITKIVIEKQYCWIVATMIQPRIWNYYALCTAPTASRYCLPSSDRPPWQPDEVYPR